MTVAELIRELRMMPHDLVVAYSAHDNSSWEIADFIKSVVLFDKEDSDFQPLYELSGIEAQTYRDEPRRAVVLRS